jgi:hypothetical protein
MTGTCNGWTEFLVTGHIGKWRPVMLHPLILGSTLALAALPAFAGPCTEKVAELEKSILAKHEGAGPALSAPSTTGSTQQASAPAESKPDNEAMALLQQAKQLDQQGKESECMAIATRVGAIAPAQTK